MTSLGTGEEGYSGEGEEEGFQWIALLPQL